MPEPRPRTPAQIEASRRNGARSKGPVTPAGKERASRNALKHGLTALHHLVLEDEVPDALEALIDTVAEEVGAETEIEHRLARRLAIAFWKSERAERIETALFDAAPKIRPPTHGFQWEEADPLTTFDVRRFNAVRGYQAQQGREIGRRVIQGGRKEVRSALYMATLALSRRASRFALAYRALIARGKPKKLALAATMRKLLVTLNAIARSNTPWREQPLKAAA